MGNGKLTENDLIIIFNKSNGRCSYCGKKLILEERKLWNKKANGYWETDHVVPKIQGGNGKINNLIPSCLWCNQKKKGRTPEEYRNYIKEKMIKDLNKEYMEELIEINNTKISFYADHLNLWEK